MNAPTRALTPDQSPEEHVVSLAQAARSSLPSLAQTSADTKTAALRAAASALRARADDIIAANAMDLEDGRKADLPAAMIDRLALTPERLEGIAKAVEDIAALPDPVGAELAQWSRPNGLNITRVRVPIGLIGVIYESRPNVTVDAAALCFKAGNGVILRGGKESLNSALALHGAFTTGLMEEGINPAVIGLVTTRDRAAVTAMLTRADCFDLVVPRGGKSLVAKVQTESRVPVLAHLEGICHTYVDGSADLAMAADIVLNAKMRRPGICGATETLLLDSTLGAAAVPILAALREAGCEIRADKDVLKLMPEATPATQADWQTEYLEPVISVGVVDGVEGALAHIQRYSSGHTDAIVAQDARVAETFLNQVDSAIVMHNTSTQFADGGEFGMGAEIGIATGRMHARGPVGVEQLTTYKYQVTSDGAVRPA